MKLAAKLITTACLALVSLSTTASADTYHHIDQLACRIERNSRLLVRELEYYRQLPEYRHLLCDARDLAKCAGHLHDLAIHRACLRELESDARQLDTKFHHFELLFERMSRRSSCGRGPAYDHLRPVRRLLHGIGDDLLHLRADLRTIRRLEETSHVRPPLHRNPPIHAQPIAVGRPSYSRDFDRHYPHSRDLRSRSQRYPGRSISIGGGSSRFTFHF